MSAGQRASMNMRSHDLGLRCTQNGHTTNCMYKKCALTNYAVSSHATRLPKKNISKNNKNVQIQNATTRTPNAPQNANSKHDNAQTQNTSTRKPTTRQCSNPKHDNAQTRNTTTRKPKHDNDQPKTRQRSTRHPKRMTRSNKHDKQMHGTKKRERERERQLQPLGLCP